MRSVYVRFVETICHRGVCGLWIRLCACVRVPCALHKFPQSHERTQSNSVSSIHRRLATIPMSEVVSEESSLGRTVLFHRRRLALSAAVRAVQLVPQIFVKVAHTVRCGDAL